MCVCVFVPVPSIVLNAFMLDLFFVCYELYHFRDNATVQVPLGFLDWHVESHQGFQIRPPHLAAGRKTICRNQNGTEMYILVYMYDMFKFLYVLFLSQLTLFLFLLLQHIRTISYYHC